MLRPAIIVLFGASGAAAHTMSAVKFVQPDVDPAAVVACHSQAAVGDCAAILNPCAAAFGVAADADITTRDEAMMHDMLACVMANTDRLEDALIAALPPGTDYTPGQRMQDIRFLHHRIPVSDCGVSDDATLSDWLCEQDRIGRTLHQVMTTGRLE